jgi:ABC-2 type transport system ATP-binding protein
MDEAERCHRLAYIAYGRLLATGTPQELVALSGLHTVEGSGPAIVAQAAAIQRQPGVALVTRFGNLLHASGRDAAALEAALRAFGDGPAWRSIPTTLEDVFIFLMQGADRP